MRFSFLFRCVFSILIIIVTTTIMLRFSSQKINETYQSIALKECKSFVSQIVSDVIDMSIDEEEFSNSMLIEVNESYKEFNITYLHSLLKEITNNVCEVLNRQEIIKVCEVPFSLIFDNPMLSFLGPNIPVNIKLNTDVIVDLSSNVSSFGINNALIELLINLEFDVLIYVPVNVKSEKIKIDFPLYSSLIEGDVPNLTFGNHNLL